MKQMEFPQKSLNGDMGRGMSSTMAGNLNGGASTKMNPLISRELAMSNQPFPQQQTMKSPLLQQPIGQQPISTVNADKGYY